MPSSVRQMQNYRNDLFMHQGSGNIPSINRQSPSSTTSPWSGHADMPMATSIFGTSFFNDSNENLGQISPGFAPPYGMGFPGDGEDRRPSIASATTISSSGSKSSIGGKRKKLQGFFGEDVYTNAAQEGGSRQNSETSSMQGGQLPGFGPGGGPRNRNNSMNDSMLRSGPPSPGSASRPRTPAPGQPSSEVTPWVFQDTQVSNVGVSQVLGDMTHVSADDRSRS